MARYCDCYRKCGSVMTVVSRAKYRSHAKYRTPNCLAPGCGRDLVSVRRAPSVSEDDSKSEREDEDLYDEAQDNQGGSIGFEPQPPNNEGGDHEMDDTKADGQDVADQLRNVLHFNDNDDELDEDPAAAMDPGSIEQMNRQEDHEENEQATRGYRRDEDEHAEGDQERHQSPPPLNPNPPPLETISIDDVHLPHLRLALRFQHALVGASLEKDSISAATYLRLQDPLREPEPLDDPDEKLSLKLFFALSTSASRATYDGIASSFNECLGTEAVWSYNRIRCRAADISGVDPVKTDMCPGGCLGFTGPLRDFKACPNCGASRYKTGKKDDNPPVQQFTTIPLGPQLQALTRTPESMAELSYRHTEYNRVVRELQLNDRELQSWDDWTCGTTYVEAVNNGQIGQNNFVVCLSSDGAQMYRDKMSDTWIYIWIVMDLRPGIRYKEKYILFGGFIPGPNKPKNLDLFFFPGLYHLGALQNDGFNLYNAITHQVCLSRPWFYLNLTDGPGDEPFTGFVGHTGRHGCRQYCYQTGRHKPGCATYYLSLLKPDEYHVEGCDQPDWSGLFDADYTRDTERYNTNVSLVLQSRSQPEFEDLRLQTGIVKPSILAGLPEAHRLPLPILFPGDQMHRDSINIPEHLFKLFQGTLDCAPTDNRDTWPFAFLRDDSIWKCYSAAVVRCGRHIPARAGRIPRSPAEKINSGYKANEYLLLVRVLSPALWMGIMPNPFWHNFCKLTRAIRVIHQWRIRRDDGFQAGKFLLEWHLEYEELYSQRRTDRLHFIPPSIHALLHTFNELQRFGPGAYYGQWGMECSVSVLKNKLRLHSSPMANLAEAMGRDAQRHATYQLYPELAPASDSLPNTAVNLGGGFAFLGPRDKYVVRDQAGELVVEYLRGMFPRGDIPDGNPEITRWARLAISSNGHEIRSAWKENQRDFDKVRMCRNVKPNVNDKIEYGEVQFFGSCRLTVNSPRIFFAVILLYSPPRPDILEASVGVVYACTPDAFLTVVNVKEIISLAIIFPFDHEFVEMRGYYCVGELPGFENGNLTGVNDDGIDADPGTL